MAAAKIRYVCTECGFESGKWLGKCPGCESWNTLEELTVVSTAAASASRGIQARPLSTVSTQRTARVDTGMSELDRVLGGGIAPGMVALLGGDPGIGKSTLLLQVADYVAKSAGVLYVSGEESESQIKHRADRLGVAGEIMILSESDVSVVEAQARALGSELILIDSIQTMSCPGVSSAPGSVSQIRECTALLTRLAKQTGAAVFLVGHVTKDGAIAGPRVLEHMVDTVLYFEGDRHDDIRLLRAVKNRWGSTNEIGVFEMTELGMRQIEDPSGLFLSGHRLPGCAILCAMEGTRPIMAEVQALLSQSAFASPRRTAAGMDHARLSLLLAVLERRANIRLHDKDVYVDVVGGLRLFERAADLAVALCIASCLLDVPLPANTAVIGEIALTGEIRPVSLLEKRVRECVRLGYDRVVVPKGAAVRAVGAKLIPVENIAQAVALINP